MNPIICCILIAAIFTIKQTIESKVSRVERISYRSSSPVGITASKATSKNQNPNVLWSLWRMRIWEILEVSFETNNLWFIADRKILYFIFHPSFALCWLGWRNGGMPSQQGRSPCWESHLRPTKGPFFCLSFVL